MLVGRVVERINALAGGEYFAEQCLGLAAWMRVGDQDFVGDAGNEAVALGGKFGCSTLLLIIER